MTNYITVEDFGSDLPENWEKIADFLNGIIEETGIADDSDAVAELWQKFWELTDYDAKNFERVSHPDLMQVSGALYDGGWRAEDRTDMMRTYVLSADNVDEVIKYFAEYEAKEKGEI